MTTFGFRVAAEANGAPSAADFKKERRSNMGRVYRGLAPAQRVSWAHTWACDPYRLA